MVLKALCNQRSRLPDVEVEGLPNPPPLNAGGRLNNPQTYLIYSLLVALQIPQALMLLAKGSI